MTSDDTFAASLRKVGLKTTEPRLSVLRALSRLHSPLRIKDLHARLKKAKSKIDMVTIYRTVETLTEKNMVRRVDFGEGAAYYEWNNGEDSHHMSCLNCKKRESVKNCFFPEFEARVMSKVPTFKQITHHSIEYFGLCKKCATKQSKKK